LASCPLCRQRKGHRLCPARGDLICSQCCGTKRRVEIACPADCSYLTGAHAGSWEGRETERQRDARRLAPFLEALNEDQGRIFLMALVGVASLRARHPTLDDALLREAVTALRKTTETRERGVVYEHRPDDLRALDLVADLRGLFEAKDSSGRVTAPADADVRPVLAAIEGALVASQKENAGRALFLETVTRIAAQFGAMPATPRSSLILEP
jgi:hypothetical protein